MNQVCSMLDSTSHKLPLQPDVHHAADNCRSSGALTTSAAALLLSKRWVQPMQLPVSRLCRGQPALDGSLVFRACLVPSPSLFWS